MFLWQLEIRPMQIPKLYFFPNFLKFEPIRKFRSDLFIYLSVRFWAKCWPKFPISFSNLSLDIPGRDTRACIILLATYFWYILAQSRKTYQHYFQGMYSVRLKLYLWWFLAWFSKWFSIYMSFNKHMSLATSSDLMWYSNVISPPISALF